MKLYPLGIIISLFLAGCASQPPPPPKSDPLVSVVSGMVALAQMAEASKQAPAIRADTAGLFPARSQAIALSLVSFRSERKQWPTSKDELRAFLVAAYPNATPPEREFTELKLVSTTDEDISFGFSRAGIPDENYRLTRDGVISFPLSLHRAKPNVVPATTSDFNWADLAARLFIELPLRMKEK